MSLLLSKAAAILVHYENPECTSNLLRQLQSFSWLDSVVVVMHSSFPTTEQNPQVHYVSGENRGYAAGINLGFKYLIENRPAVNVALAMNPDVAITEQEALEMLRLHEQTASDCTFPSIRENGSTIHGYRFNNFGTMMQVADDPRYFPATCFLLNINAWEKIGGLNESYFHYYEDADLCMQLQRSECRIQHASNVIISHVGKSGADYPATDLPRFAVRNHLLFLSQLGKMNAISFLNVSARHLFYLFRWKKGWRGVGEWYRGIREFRQL